MATGWLVRVNEATTLERVEIRSIKWGYSFPSSCTLYFPGVHDADPTVLTNNNIIEISKDDSIYASLVFKGYLETNSPQGVSSEGVTYNVVGLEGVLNRYITKFNNSIDYTYNVDGLPDYNSPNVGGGRWTVGQIMIDVLEHALGIPEAGSDIPFHHPYAASVTSSYIPTSLLASYSAANILAMTLELEEYRITSQGLWDTLQSLIQRMDYHGIFVDPSDPADPTLVLHDFTTSTNVNFVCGQLGTHIDDTETSVGSPLVIDNKMRFDITQSKTKVIIEGRGIIQELIPITRGGLKNGTLVPHWDESGGDAGTRYIVEETMLFTPLWEGVLSNGMRGPILVLDGQPCHTDFADWNLKTGIVSTAQDLRGFSTIEVQSLYLSPFQVTAGPGGTAFDNHGLVSEIAFYDDSMLHPSHPYCERYNLITTYNSGAAYDCAYGAYTQELSGEEYCAPMPPRDDTTIMQAIANAILNQVGDEKIFATITLDGIDLDEYTLLKQGNLTGLSKWSALGAQIMSIEVIPNEDTMRCELTNDIYQMPGYAEWKRRFQIRYRQGFLQRLIDSLRHFVSVGGSTRFFR